MATMIWIHPMTFMHSCFLRQIMSPRAEIKFVVVVVGFAFADSLSETISCHLPQICCIHLGTLFTQWFVCSPVSTKKYFAVVYAF